MCLKLQKLVPTALMKISHHPSVLIALNFSKLFLLDLPALIATYICRLIHFVNAAQQQLQAMVCKT